MIEGIKGAIERVSKDVSKDRVTLGIDLSDDYAQISYMSVQDKEPETVALDDQGERLLIPAVLAKKYGEDLWTYGEEALSLVQENDGFLIDHLLNRAREGNFVEVEAKDYNPVDLLALFLKRCLSRASGFASLEKVAAIVITIEEPDGAMIEALSKAIATLRIKPERVYFQSHAESVYHYILQQSPELWNHDVLVCDMQNRGMHVMMFQKNNQTHPVVLLMKEQWFPDFLPEDFVYARSPEGRKEQKDQELRTILYSFLDGRICSSVYLLGDGFEGDWYPESLKYLCRGRRAFRGNNLYSKGACYGAKDKLVAYEVEKHHVFLGKDKLKYNLGMEVVRENINSYMVLLDAGKNWYDSFRECDLILDQEDSLQIIVTPLDGKKMREVIIHLTGMPVRPPRASRVHLEVRMLSEALVRIVVTDLGFGEFFPSSGLVWTNEFEL